MLIFNPRYHDFLKNLKAKESMTSELSRIFSQPYDNRSKSLKKKKEYALYAFTRTQQKQQGVLEQAKALAGKKQSAILEKSQSAIQNLNNDVIV